MSDKTVLKSFGQYFTKDGDIYKGKWKDDKLMETEPVEVTFVDGTQFIGNLVKNKYDGPGVYCFPHSIILSCEFRNNKPTGEMTLIDFKGKEWHGMALPNQDSAVLLPENIYFKDIHQDVGKGRRKYEPPPKSPKKRLSDVQEHSRNLINERKSLKKKEKSITSMDRAISTFEVQLANEQKRIFGKTKKTASDLKLEESDWYKNYTNFKAHYDNIKNRIESAGEKSLNENEKEWYGKYLQFKKRYCEIMNQRQTRNRDMPQEKLFQLLDHEKFRASCPPVSVFYATEHCVNISAPLDN